MGRTSQGGAVVIGNHLVKMEINCCPLVSISANHFIKWLNRDSKQQYRHSKINTYFICVASVTCETEPDTAAHTKRPLF